MDRVPESSLACIEQSSVRLLKRFPAFGRKLIRQADHACAPVAFMTERVFVFGQGCKILEDALRRSRWSTTMNACLPLGAWLLASPILGSSEPLGATDGLMTRQGLSNARHAGAASDAYPRKPSAGFFSPVRTATAVVAFPCFPNWASSN